jgi:hypothetical protein
LIVTNLLVPDSVRVMLSLLSRVAGEWVA